MAEPIEIVKRSLVRKPYDDDSIMDYGKLPPQDVETEKAILGACLLEDCIADVATILKPDHFYTHAHQLIFSSMIRLFGASVPIDLLTVRNDLEKNGSLDAVGGPYYLAVLSNSVGSAGNVEAHSLMVKERWIKRALITCGTRIVRDSYEDSTDPFELIDKAGAELDSVITEINSSQSKDFAQTLYRQLDEIRAASQKTGEQKHIIGLRTGLHSLDRKILGWTAPDMVLIAGRPGEGKTSFALQSAKTSLEQGKPVGFISGEMTLEQLNLKLLSMNSDIAVKKIMSGNLTTEEWDKIEEAKILMANYQLYVYDKPCTPEELRAIFKTWYKKYGIKLGVVDYIQRMKIPKYIREKNRDAQITVVSNAIKDTCLYLEIPILALSQMSRDIEKRKGGDSRPQLTDLRDSGSLEQDADIAIFVYRPEIHGIKNYQDGSTTKGCTEFIVEKHRLGTKGTVKAKFMGIGGRFDDTDFTADNAEANNEKTDDSLPF